MKAFIVEKSSENSYKVRIPALDGDGSVVPSSKLSSATVCTLPNCSPNFATGDVVVVDFEEDNTTNPVILGRFCAQDGSKTFCDLDINSIETDGKVILPKGTKIGDVSYKTLESLYGISNNLQNSIDTIKTTKFKSMDSAIKENDKSIKENSAKLNDNQLSIEANSELIGVVNKKIGNETLQNTSTVYGGLYVVNNTFEKISDTLGSFDSTAPFYTQLQAIESGIENLKELKETLKTSGLGIGSNGEFSYDVDKTKVQNMLDWGKLKCDATNPPILYSQDYRYAGYGHPQGRECYDCASFVWYAIKNGGWNIEKYCSSAFSVGYLDSPSYRIYPVLVKDMGWKYHEGLSGVSAGDVLVRWGHHTEIALDSTHSMGAHSSKYTEEKQVSVVSMGNSWDGYIRSPSV